MPVLDSEPIPELFSGKNLPCLRYVELSYCKCPAPSLLLRANLTSLILKSCERFWDSIDDLLSFLSASPTLKVIKISADHHGYPLARNVHPVHNSPQSVTMPSLRWLHLDMEFECIVPLLQALSLPYRAEIDINGDYLMVPRVYNVQFVNLVRELKEALDRHLRQSYPSTIPLSFSKADLQDGFRRVTIQDYGPNYGDEGVAIIAELPNSVDNGPPTFELGACYLADSIKENLEIIRTTLVLPGIRGAFTRLIVDKRQLLHVSWHWHTIFKHLGSVEVIDLSGPPARAFLRAYGEEDGFLSEYPAIPRLQKIIIRNAKVGVDVVSETLNCLTMMGEGGAPRSLSFSFFNCTIAEETLHLLREHKHVDQVVWDGRSDGWEGEKGRQWWESGYGGEEGGGYDSDGTVSGEGTEDDEWW
ncbi:unnamed protein product [Peniophora sp. CBMAI 1063]|nr:unnamed protein product [Peniophora sp. CBMAI 1063]